MPDQPLFHNPATYLHTAFVALHWPHLTFEAAMHDTARADIIKFIATHWPQRPMHHIVSVSKIDLMATDAARRGASARGTNPYSDHSPPGQLWLKCFAAEQTRLTLAAAAQAASVYTDE